jgi:hypothetical protein
VLALIARLNHSDQPVAAERVPDHGPVTRLEDVKRELRPREEQGACQWKDREAAGQLAHQVKRMAESRRRCVAAQGSSSPTTSSS